MFYVWPGQSNHIHSFHVCVSFLKFKMSKTPEKRLEILSFNSVSVCFVLVSGPTKIWKTNLFGQFHNTSFWNVWVNIFLEIFEELYSIYCNLRKNHLFYHVKVVEKFWMQKPHRERKRRSAIEWRQIVDNI